MARKRLSEFLREEAQKSLEVTPTPENQTTKAKTGKSAGQKRQSTATAKPAQVPPQDTTQQTSQTARKTRTTQTKSTGAKGEKGMAPVKAPAPETNGVSAAQTKLEETVAELKAALQEAKVREEVLQHQVESLQSDLSAAQESTAKLQKEQTHTAQIKNELEEARKVILQLSELNADLNEQLKQVKAAPKPPGQTAAAALQAPAKAPAHDASRMITPEMHSQMELRRMLQHPTAPGAPPNTAMTNEEIGWVD